MSRPAYAPEPLILLMFAAYDALRRHGWRDACYAPIGPTLQLIEPGSTGIHRGSRDEERRFWIFDDLDAWPSSPILYRHPEGAAPLDLLGLPEDACGAALRERWACAQKVEQAGCVCYSLYRLDEMDGTRHWKVSIDFRCTPPRITEHALCCPVALAEALRRTP